MRGRRAGLRSLRRRWGRVYDGEPEAHFGGFFGAVGVIAKPYTHTGLKAVLAYLTGAVCSPPPTLGKPPGLTLAPAFEREWQTKVGSV